MVHLGMTFGSAVLKPISIFSASVVARQSHSTSTFLQGVAISLGGVRHYGSSIKSKTGDGDGHIASASASELELSLQQQSTLTPGLSSTPTSKINGSTNLVSSESVANGFKVGGDVVISFKAGDTEEYFDLSKSFTRSEKWKSKLVSTMLVYPNFISEEEEVSILKEIEPYISRLHYENSHWDDAIHEYRETERSKWNKKNELVINRIRELAFPPGVAQLKLVHILDLAKKGLIKPHIDSIRFCGNTITGLSLLSNCVMRLKHDVQTDFFCDVYLPRLSLYVMKDFSRFEFTHEILGEADSKFKNKLVQRDRRVSVICRNEPENTTGPVFKPLM